MLMGHSHKHPPTREEVLIFQHVSTSKFLRSLPSAKLFFARLVWCCGEKSVYLMHNDLFHTLPMKQAVWTESFQSA